MEKEIKTSEKPALIGWLTSPSKCVSEITATTVNQAIASTSPVIGILVGFNKTSAKAILVLLISDVIKFLNVGQTMGETQLVQTVDLILGDLNFKNLKPDDFKVCFDNAKKGYYGKSYNRIDGMVICEWLSIYCSERANICESMAIQKAAEDKKKVDLIAPEVVELYQKIYDENNGFKEIEKTQVVPAKKLIEKSPRDKFIQKCLTDFDTLATEIYEKGKQVPGKYVVIDGENLDVVSYTELKLTEYDQLIEEGKQLEL